MIRVSHAALAALIIAPVAGFAQQPPIRGQYKNAVLGMTLAEWKALPFPGAAAKPNELIGFICTDNPKWEGFRDPIPADPVELSIGVTECSYYTDSKSRSFTFTMRSMVPIGETRFSMFDTDYAFYRGRLFRIRGFSQIGAEKDIVEGLTARFGKPMSVDAGNVQNRLGAVFPKASYTWDLGSDVIRLEAPGGSKIDQVAVLYLDKAAAAALEAEKERSDPAINKM